MEKKSINRPSKSAGEPYTITQVNQETTSFDTTVVSACIMSIMNSGLNEKALSGDTYITMWGSNLE